METLRAQCAAFEQNLVDINKSFQKERDEHGMYLRLKLVFGMLILKLNSFTFTINV